MPRDLTFRGNQKTKKYNLTFAIAFGFIASTTQTFGSSGGDFGDLSGSSTDTGTRSVVSTAHGGSDLTASGGTFGVGVAGGF